MSVNQDVVLSSAKGMFWPTPVDPHSLNSSPETLGHSSDSFSVDEGLLICFLEAELRVYLNFNYFALVFELSSEDMSVKLDQICRPPVKHSSAASPSMNKPIEYAFHAVRNYLYSRDEESAKVEHNFSLLGRLCLDGQ